MGAGGARPHAGDQDLSKTFTLSEAQTLLPVVEALLRKAQSAAVRAGQIEQEMQMLSHRIFLSGGLHVDVSVAARRKAEHDKAVQEAKDTLGEIDSIGVQVKDLEQGLLDFPSVMDGKTVLLCWKLGEPTIAYWHTEEEGFAGRKPLDPQLGKTERFN
jgi:hypothetical protein